MGCKSCCGGCFRKQADSLLDLVELDLLLDNSYYVVRVSMREGNPAFLAVLYTGFVGGSSTLHYSDDCFEVNSDVRMKIVAHITDMDSV